MAYSDDRYTRHSNDLLDNLGRRLAELRSKAESSRDDYRKQLQVAAASGFMTDYTNVLGGDKFMRFSSYVDGLIEIIDISRREMVAHKQIIEKLAEDARRRGSS